MKRVLKTICALFIFMLFYGCEENNTPLPPEEQKEPTETSQTTLPDWSSGESENSNVQEAQIYEITSAQELLSFALSTHSVYNGEMAKNWVGYIITLKNDIDLRGYDIPTIGTKETPFMGSFDGGEFTISNLEQVNYQNYQGLFGAIGYGAKVYNLKVDNFVIGDKFSTNEVGYGVLAGFNGGVISNCEVRNSTVYASSKVSLFVGENNGTLQNCLDGGGNKVNIIE